MIELTIGLGNIGRHYIGTRHNVGFETLNRVCERHGVTMRPSKPLYEYVTISRDVKQASLAWPLTLMNRSGKAVDALLQDFKLESSQILVVVDDYNLPLGRLRFRAEGSDGGHNGLASIIETLGTENFPRLRLGIGPPPDKMDSAEFVLQPFGSDEIDAAKQMIDEAAKAVEYAIDNRLELAMSKYNVNPA